MYVRVGGREGRAQQRQHTSTNFFVALALAMMMMRGGGRSTNQLTACLCEESDGRPAQEARSKHTPCTLPIRLELVVEQDQIGQHISAAHLSTLCRRHDHTAWTPHPCLPTQDPVTHSSLVSNALPQPTQHNNTEGTLPRFVSHPPTSRAAAGCHGEDQPHHQEEAAALATPPLSLSSSSPSSSSCSC